MITKDTVEYIRDCSQDCNKYIERLSFELQGCSEKYMMDVAVFSTFCNLSIYFPEAYKHMLKVWKIENE